MASGHITGNRVSLPGNEIWLDLEWSENLSGTSNQVTVRMTAHTKYRINGVWQCKLVVDGQDSGVSKFPIIHNAGGSSNLTTMTKTITYSGDKTIHVKGGILNMDYSDVHSSGWGNFTAVVEGDIRLTCSNTPPPKPVLKCNNAGAAGWYIAEGFVVAELSQVHDPNGDRVRYGIFGQAMKPNETDWHGGFGDQNDCVLWSFDKRDVKVDIRKFPRGTKFALWGRAYDESGATEGMTNVFYNIKRNTAPTPVTNIQPSTGYFNNETFTISWNKGTDIDKQEVTTNVYVSKSSGDFVLVAKNTKGTSYTHNIQADNEGTSYKFKLCSHDGLIEGQPVYTNYYYKNCKPSTPSYIFPNSGYLLGDVNITWNKSVDPDGQGISKYIVFINDKQIGESNSNSLKWHMPDSDAPGTSYLVSVTALDVNGRYSERGKATGSFKKPGPPKKIGWINPKQKFQNDKVDLDWEDVIRSQATSKYILEYNIINQSWQRIGETHTNSFSHNIVNIARGQSFQYRIKAINSFGQESEWQYSIVYTRAIKPICPIIEYPKNNSKVYDKHLRIAFKVKREPNGEIQHFFVNCNDSTFNSLEMQSMFSKGSSVDECNVVFTCDNLKAGNNKIMIYANNGVVDGDMASLDVEVLDNELTFNSNDFITASKINDLKRKVDTLLPSYGFEEKRWTDKTSIGSYILHTTLNEIAGECVKIRKVIDDYDTTNAHKLGSIYNKKTSDTFIFANDFQACVNVINHV